MLYAGRHESMSMMLILFSSRTLTTVGSAVVAMIWQIRDAFFMTLAIRRR